MSFPQSIRDADNPAELTRNLRPHGLLALWVAVSLLSGQAAAADRAPSADVDESWQVIYLQGQRVGYAHARTWESTQAGQKRIWSEVVTAMKMKRFGGSLNMTVTQLTEEDEQGNMLSFAFETDNPPSSNTKTTGRVDGDVLRLTTVAAGRESHSAQPWDADVKSPVYQERLLKENPIRPGQTRTMKIFDPQFLKLADLTFRGMEPGTTKLLDGKEKKLDRVSMTHSLVPVMVTTIYTDAEGENLKAESNLLQMVTYTVSREEAVKEIVGAELDLAINTLVRVGRIDQAHRSQRIVYELTVDRPQLPVSLPAGSTQSVEKVNEKTYHVTVTSVDPRGDAAPPGGASPQEVDEKYLVSSRQLECGHPAVVELAEAAAANLTDAAEIAVAMESFVQRTVRSKNFSTAMATAAEVAQSKEGDCTEHAMLLAAMLRIKQIPSRIAVGLVYAESHQAFGGHMWTEAYLNGRWVPLDATLGRGGIGGGHIKFTDSSLADDAPAAVASFVPLVGLLEHMKLRVIEKR